MVAGFFSASRELPRLREISTVFVRHGLGDLVRRAGIATLLEHAGQVLHWGEAPEIAQLEPHQRARLAFEQLGPTFVKLGQMLSTREDLLPSAWTTELARLHSDVAPVPFDDLLPQVEQALRRSPFEVFAHVEREPYAAASIAQIHRAKLASGTPVVLKIPSRDTDRVFGTHRSKKCRKRLLFGVIYFYQTFKTTRAVSTFCDSRGFRSRRE